MFCFSLPFPPHYSRAFDVTKHKARIRQLVRWATNGSAAFHRVLTTVTLSTFEDSTRSTGVSIRSKLATLFNREAFKCIWTRAARCNLVANKAADKLKAELPGLQTALSELTHREEPQFFPEVQTGPIVKSIAQSTATRVLTNVSNLKHSNHSNVVGLVAHILQAPTATVKTFIRSSHSLFDDMLNATGKSRKVQLKVKKVLKVNERLSWF